jgi:hypothetical protein
MKKELYSDIFARRYNIILRKQARITYFFQNFKAKNHFVVTLYIIGRFFSALAARDRVKEA